MLQSLADQIIHQLEKDYDRIAPHFSDTRSHAWPEFYLLNNLINDCGVETIHELSLLDVGCGNGRLLETIPAVHYTGLDLSSQLLTIAQNRFPNYTFVHGSVLQLPFLDEQFDVVACVATWQHIPLVLYRHQALQEMVRVLKPGGHLFMLNWNLADQTQYQQYRADQTNGYDAGDYLIPWKNDRGEILTQRYSKERRINNFAE